MWRRGRAPGWVYILTNPSMPGLVKIGHTSRYSEIRAQELSRPTAVPTRFVVVWDRAVSDSPYVENTVKRMLADKRQGDSEFFRCEVKVARQVIEAAAGARFRKKFRPQAGQGAVGKRRSWRRESRTVEAILLLAGFCLVAGIFISQPNVPAWFPRPVREFVAAIESLHR